MPDRLLDANHIRVRFQADGYSSPESFVKEFGERSPDAKTIRKFLNAPEDVSNSILRKIDNCLRVPQRQFHAYSTLAQSLGVGPSEETRARSLLGLYKYHRPGTDGKKTTGGLYLFEVGGLFRFFHFRNSEKFSTFISLLRSAETDKRAAPFKLAGNKEPADDHRGYFFCQFDRIYLVGMDNTYFRTIMGHPVDDMSQKYMRVLVMAYGLDKRAFSAKSFLVHESNKRFDSDFTEADICRILEIKFLHEGILHA